MNARTDAIRQQINEMRESARAIREGIEKTTEQANDWQRKANEARKLVALLQEKARIWDVLADGLDSGELHDIAAPLGTGHDDRPTNADIYALQGRLMTELPEYQLDAWSIHCGQLKAMLHRLHGGSRKAIAEIAERLNIGYSEKPHPNGQLYLEAGGEVDGIPVEIWCLLPDDSEKAAEPECERTTLAEQLRARGAEQAAQDAENDAFHAQRRADEAEANGEYVDYDEVDAVREIEREMAIEAGDDSEIDRQVTEDDARFERAMWLANRDAESEADR